MGETLVQVDGVATIDGALSINLGAPVDDGDYLTLINATEIVGEFTSVDVQARGSSCARADIVQDSQSLAALLYAFPA